MGNMGDEKYAFTQDYVIDSALAEFGKMLKKRHALLRRQQQITKDCYVGADKPIAAEALDNADLLTSLAFRDLCMAAEWEPNMDFSRRRQESALSDAYYYRELLRTLPSAEFKRLVLGEWVAPLDYPDGKPGE
jgi:hypothetical protein